MICNKCGKDCDVPVSTHEPPLMNTCGEAYSYVGCYGSYVLKDMTKYEWCLCERCVAELFKSFVLPPTESDA